LPFAEATELLSLFQKLIDVDVALIKNKYPKNPFEKQNLSKFLKNQKNPISVNF
jgi:hypothetical protein